MATRRILAAALVLAGCGGSVTNGPAPTAVLTLTASPNPVVGGLCGSDCGNLEGERQALTDLTIRETAGVGVHLTGGSQVLRDNATGAVMNMSGFIPSIFIRDAGTARIPASGQLVFPTGIHYPAVHAGATATFTFTIEAIDDNGHAVSVTLAVPTTG